MVLIARYLVKAAYPICFYCNQAQFAGWSMGNVREFYCQSCQSENRFGTDGEPVDVFIRTGTNAPLQYATRTGKNEKPQKFQLCESCQDNQRRKVEMIARFETRA